VRSGYRRVVAGSAVTVLLAASYLLTNVNAFWYVGVLVWFVSIVTWSLPAPWRWDGKYHWNWKGKP
jgi:hypothetical protein